MGICNCKAYYRIHQLEKCTNDMPLFSFEGKHCYAKIVDVYDGDTFKACIHHNGKLIKINCRTLGYDSPEMKPRLNIKNREEHIHRAHLAKAYFKKVTNCDNSLVYLDCHKYDKYGRVLVTVYSYYILYNFSRNRDNVDKKSVNNAMIKEGHGVPYDGGKKQEV